MTRDRGPADLRAAAEALAARLDRGGRRATAAAATLWPEAAGPQVAAHTRAVAVREGELLVHVDSNAWATELAAMGPQFADAVNSLAGKTLVRAVRFIVSRVVEEDRSRERTETERASEASPAHLAPADLDDSEMEAVEASVAGIEDERLRSAARRAMVADLQWKKAAEQAERGSEEGSGKG